jgi:hypothetical protein
MLNRNPPLSLKLPHLIEVIIATGWAFLPTGSRYVAEECFTFPLMPYCAPSHWDSEQLIGMECSGELRNTGTKKYRDGVKPLP